MWIFIAYCMLFNPSRKMAKKKGEKNGEKNSEKNSFFQFQSLLLCVT